MLRERGADQQWISVIRMAGLSKAGNRQESSADFIFIKPPRNDLL